MVADFKKIPRSDDERILLEKAARCLPAGTRNPTMDPACAMIIKEARGAYITDLSGNRYLDYLLASGPMLLGHAHPSVVAAVGAQLERGSSYLMGCEATVELAEKIIDAVPCAERVCFSNTGSEAVLYALRLARAWRDRDKILKFEGGYHGQADYALMSNQWTANPKPHPEAVANSLGIPACISEQVLVAPFNDTATSAQIIEDHHDELGAVIVEPMQRTVVPNPGFLEGLAQACSRFDIPLIFDEVVTGFRLAYGGAQEYYGVVPDLCVVGKSISAGHPLGVVCGRADIMAFAEADRQLSGGYVSLTGTYSGNPVSCVAALAVLGELEKEGVYESLFAKGLRLKNGLQTLFDDAGITATVSGEAPAFEPWFCNGPASDFRWMRQSDFRRSVRFTSLLLERGVMKAHEKFFVSTVHSDEDVEFTLGAFASAVAELAG